jgi:hypothetical protein
MLDDEIINLMTPYFARHKAVRDGMLQLYTLFFGRMEEGEDGFRRRRTPTQPVTYDRMLSILRDIREGIDHTEDPYPDAQFRLNARERYHRYLKSGNRMPLMAEEEEVPVTKVENVKRVAHTSHPDGSQRGSKRGRTRDAGNCDGGRKGRGRGKSTARG